MRRKIIDKLPLLIILAFQNYATCQNNKFDAAFILGPTFTSLYGNEILSAYNNPTILYATGLEVRYKVKDHWYIELNCFYEIKGAVAKGDNAVDQNGSSLGTYKTYNRLHYFIFPLLLRYQFGKKILGFVNAGAFAGYLKSHQSITKYPGDLKAYGSLYNVFNKHDLGICLGAGIIKPIRKKLFLSFEARENLGLSNISRVPVVNNGSIKTNSVNFIFGIGYKFGIPKEEI